MFIRWIQYGIGLYRIKSFFIVYECHVNGDVKLSSFLQQLT